MKPLKTFTSIRDLVRYAVSRFTEAGLFFGHGSDNAYDEAVYLILHTLRLPVDRLEPFIDAKLLKSEVKTVIDIIEQRIKSRKPAAYLTKEAFLGDYRFYIDERALIPRSFIAELIPEQFSPWIEDPDNIDSVLELCTGSGCLAIMLADAFPYAQIDATDISSDALEVAKINVKEYGLNERVNLIKSDIYENIKPKRYQLIVANPPYVNNNSMKYLPEEYLHEPQNALAGGKDGMDLVRKIVNEAKNHLTDNGILVVEIGNEYENAINAFDNLELTWLPTSGGDDRVFLIEANQLPSR